MTVLLWVAMLVLLGGGLLIPPRPRVSWAVLLVWGVPTVLFLGWVGYSHSETVGPWFVLAVALLTVANVVGSRMRQRSYSRGQESPRS